jgi:hypothetical protein
MAILELIAGYKICNLFQGSAVAPTEAVARPAIRTIQLLILIP